MNPFFFQMIRNGFVGRRVEEVECRRKCKEKENKKSVMLCLFSFHLNKYKVLTVDEVIGFGYQV